MASISSFFPASAPAALTTQTTPVERSSSSGWMLLQHLAASHGEVGKLDPVLLYFGWQYALALRYQLLGQPSPWGMGLPVPVPSGELPDWLQRQIALLQTQQAQANAEAEGEAGPPVPKLLPSLSSPVPVASLPLPVARYARLAEAAYQPMHGTSFTAGPQATLQGGETVHVQATTRPFLPAHAILLDHAWRAIVLVLRGTSSLSDLMADAAGTSVQYHACMAHGGVVACAEAMMTDAYFMEVSGTSRHSRAGSAVGSGGGGDVVPLFSESERGRRSVPGQESRAEHKPFTGLAKGEEEEAVSGVGVAHAPTPAGKADIGAQVVAGTGGQLGSAADVCSSSPGRVKAMSASKQLLSPLAASTPTPMPNSATASSLVCGAGKELSSPSHAVEELGAHTSSIPALGAESVASLYSDAAGGIPHLEGGEGSTPRTIAGPYQGRPGVCAILQRLVDLYPGYRVVLTGHSLGAALAALLTVKLRLCVRFPWYGGAEGRVEEGEVPVAASTALATEAGPTAANECKAPPPASTVLFRPRTRPLPRVPVYGIGYGVPAVMSPDMSCLCSLTDEDARALGEWNTACMVQVRGGGGEDQPAPPPLLPGSMLPHAASTLCHPSRERGLAGASLDLLPPFVSVVVADDFVPRISLKSVKRLHEGFTEPAFANAAKQYWIDLAKAWVALGADTARSTLMSRLSSTLTLTTARFQSILASVSVTEPGMAASLAAVTLAAILPVQQTTASIASGITHAATAVHAVAATVGAVATTVQSVHSAAAEQHSRIVSAVTGGMTVISALASRVILPRGAAVAAVTALDGGEGNADSVGAAQVDADDAAVAAALSLSALPLMHEGHDLMLRPEAASDEGEGEGDDGAMSPLALESLLPLRGLTALDCPEEAATRPTPMGAWLQQWRSIHCSEDQSLVVPGRIYHVSRIVPAPAPGEKAWAPCLAPPSLLADFVISPEFWDDHDIKTYINVVGATAPSWPA